MSSQTLQILEGRWKNVCKVIFGKEICKLEECEDWLGESVDPLSHNRSTISGKEVISAPTSYCKGARWLSFDEVDFNKSFPPLSINEVKDIDSLLSAISERIYYSDNVVFGQSDHIEKCSNINDSHYMYHVGRHGNSKYVAYSAIGRFNEDCFGCNGNGESSFCIKSSSRSFKNTRCFETRMCMHCSGCYYSSGLVDCMDCLFCFNLRSKRQCVGNLTLGISKYKQIKEKLVDELVELLSKNKRLPSLIDIVAKAATITPNSTTKTRNEETDKNKIEQAFLDTTRVIFGNPLEGGVDRYSKWLTRHTRETIYGHSAASGKDLFMPNAVGYPQLPKHRLLSEAEAFELGEKTRIAEQDAESISMENAHEKIAGIAFFNTELFEGNNLNNIECSICFDSINNYRNSLMFYSKNSAYNFWPRNCDNVFGCDSPFSSSFSINCYSCTNQIRCFEIDCCGYCSDSYFCHNCEGMRDSMFCFNIKNKKNAIGNFEFDPVEYKKIKNSIVGQMYDELSSKKDMPWDIYNLACKARTLS